ncbi:hypothetical protein B0H10DRAFT_214296 [Mycena sp. CBHHK59/15]|nr:hypothetical protein B0H10DRAFT_214296 [Mycena sp. CBHHK59/15]
MIFGPKQTFLRFFFFHWRDLVRIQPGETAIFSPFCQDLDQPWRPKIAQICQDSYQGFSPIIRGPLVSSQYPASYPQAMYYLVKHLCRFCVLSVETPEHARAGLAQPRKYRCRRRPCAVCLCVQSIPELEQVENAVAAACIPYRWTQKITQGEMAGRWAERGMQTDHFGSETSSERREIGCQCGCVLPPERFTNSKPPAPVVSLFEAGEFVRILNVTPTPFVPPCPST